MNSRLKRETSRLIQQSNSAGIDFLLNDLNIGMTFLQIAVVTGSASGRTRSLERACEVYRTVNRLLPQVDPSPEIRLEILRKLEDLKHQLEEKGFSV